LDFKKFIKNIKYALFIRQRLNIQSLPFSANQIKEKILKLKKDFAT